MLIEPVARLALVAWLFLGVALALWKHGKTIPSYRFHAGIFVGASAVETVLIWLAGGFG